MESFPIGALVSQVVNRGDKVRRYGIVLSSRPNDSDTMLNILWQIHSKTHAVSDLAYIEPVLVGYYINIKRPIELIKRMPNV